MISDQGIYKALEGILWSIYTAKNTPKYLSFLFAKLFDLYLLLNINGLISPHG
ncbi:hypothetical protein NEOC65_001220 [Neochlamydia sp. AcF65]|nr:hypothetical protein [Neochlamydia sp. AcF65]MBS4171060.1 hypothetical protein [Neochlamydia sp. AcF95]NGY95483.1 hypothetical protein [Neochlamydia sp. AcF84]